MSWLSSWIRGDNKRPVEQERKLSSQEEQDIAAAEALRKGTAAAMKPAAPPPPELAPVRSAAAPVPASFVEGSQGTGADDPIARAKRAFQAGNTLLTGGRFAGVPAFGTAKRLLGE